MPSARLLSVAPRRRVTPLVAALALALVAGLAPGVTASAFAEASADPADGASIPTLAADAAVLHVDDDSPHDPSTGATAGTEELPYATVGAALYHAHLLRSGGEAVRVVVAPGTYREQLEITAAGDNPPLVLEAADPGTAIVSGADVERRWTPVAGTDTVTAPWPHDWGMVPVPAGWGPANLPDGVRRAEAVFVDGDPLRQVVGDGELEPGSFRVDEDADQLVVRPPAGLTTLDDHLVEVAHRPQALRIRRQAANVAVRGLVFEKAAASLQTPMVDVNNARNVLLEANTFSRSNWAGARICCSEQVTLRNNLAIANGGNGIDTNQVHDLLVEGNDIVVNNLRGAQHGYVDWSVAGSKNLRLRGAVFRGNTYEGNQARGLWFDTDVEDVLVDRDRSCGNLLTGLFVEKVQGPVTVRDTTVCDNRTGGVVVATSANVRLEGTTLAGNGRGQLVFSGTRSQTWTDHQTGQLHTVDDFAAVALVDNTFSSSDATPLVMSPVIPMEDWRRLLTEGQVVARGNTWDHPATADAIRIQGQVFPAQEWEELTSDAPASDAPPAPEPTTSEAPAPEPTTPGSPTPSPTATEAPTPDPTTPATGETDGRRLASVTRVEGPDRVATAARLAERFRTADTVLLARADHFADALVAGPLAAQLGGPLLLTATDGLAPAAREQLERLRPGRVVLVGGRAALGDGVASDVEALPWLGADDVERIAGADRYDTAATIAGRITPDAEREVFLTTGTNFPDALAGAALAARLRAPVLLTDPRALPDATSRALGAARAQELVVLGGAAAVSESVARAAGDAAGAPVDRISGPDRYATAAAVAERFPAFDAVFVATGQDFPDALAGVAAAAHVQAPVLLTQRDGLSAPVERQLQRAGGQVIVIGGRQAVSQDVEDQLRLR